MALYKRKKSEFVIEAEQYIGKIAMGVCQEPNCNNIMESHHVHIYSGAIQILSHGDFIIRISESKLPVQGFVVYPEKKFIETFDIVPTKFSLGSFCRDKADTLLTDIAIVVIDHSTINEDSELRTIKRMSDGHLSNRDIEELVELTPLEFCKVWCKDQVGYSK